MLDAKVVVLGVRSSQFLLRHGQHGEAGWGKRIGPTGEGKRGEKVRQERWIEHDVAGNVSDDGLVKHAISSAQHRTPIAEKVPGDSDARSEIIVITVVDAAYLVLRDDT